MSHLNDSFTASLTLKIILLVNYTPVMLIVVKFGHINLHIMYVQFGYTYGNSELLPDFVSFSTFQTNKCHPNWV